MKKTNIKQTCMLTALALGLTLSASAQSMQNTSSASGTPPEQTPSAPGPGLIGTNYVELSYGYQKQQNEPSGLRNIELVSNGAVLKQDNWGLDGNFTYDHYYGDANDFSDRRDEIEMGPTAFLTEFWGKPFVTADAGFAWQHAAGVSRKSYAYTVTGGVEFQVANNLVLTPYIEYQGEPHLANHELPIADLPNFVLSYGVKATYRFTRNWSASVGIDQDDHSGRDFGFRGGVSYHF
jgi:opacity protein-like surface antigen